jgi:hypothetical protein
MIVFSMSTSLLYVNLGISGFEGLIPEVVAYFVTLLKWAPYDLLLLLDSIGAHKTPISCINMSNKYIK